VYKKDQKWLEKKEFDISYKSIWKSYAIICILCISLTRFRRALDASVTTLEINYSINPIGSKYLNQDLGLIYKFICLELNYILDTSQVAAPLRSLPVASRRYPETILPLYFLSFFPSFSELIEGFPSPANSISCS